MAHACKTDRLALAACAVLALGTVGLALPSAEATTPTLSSWTINMNNTGTASGTLTLVFNTNVKVHTSEADTLSDISLYNGEETGDDRRVTSMAGTDMSINGTTVTISLTPQHKSSIDATQERILIIYISSTAFKSTDTSTDLGQVNRLSGGYTTAQIYSKSGNNPATGLNAIRTYTPDTTKPGITGATLVASSGLLRIISDDPINPASAQDNTNATKYHIRDGTGVSSGGQNLENLSIVSDLRNSSRSDRNIITSMLSGTVLTAVNAMMNPTLYVEAETFHDLLYTSIGSKVELSTSPNLNAAITNVDINYTPAPTRAVYNGGTHVLAVTFSEAVTAGGASGTPMFVSEAGRASSYSYSASSDVALAAPSSSASSRSYTLSLADQADIDAMTTPTLYARAGALKDGANLAGAAETISVELTRPKLVSASLKPGNGELTVTFSREVSVVTTSPGQIYVASTGSSGYSSTTDVLFTAGGSASETHRDTFDAAELDRIRAMSMPTLYMEASAVTTMSTANTAGSVRLTYAVPGISSAALDEGTGVLTVTFDDNVTANTGNVDVRDGSGATHAIVTDARVDVSGVAFAGATMTLTLGEEDRQKAISMSDPWVYLDAMTVTAGTGSVYARNASASAQVSDTDDGTAPTLSSAAFDEHSRVLTLTFSETVRNDGANTAGTIDIRDGPSASQVAGSVRITADPSISTDMARSTLSEADLYLVNAMTNPHVYLAASVIEDTSNNSNGAVSDRIAVVPDTTHPAILSANVDEGTGAWTIMFNEPVSPGSTTGEVLYVSESGGSTQYDASTDALLAVPSSAVSSSDTLDEQDRQNVISMTTPTVYVLADAVQDVRNNNILAGSLAASVTLDTTNPEISSASIHEGTGAWTVMFTETVSPGSAAGNVLYVAESGGGAYDASTDALLAVPSSATAISSSGTLGEQDRQKVISLNTPTVYVAQDAVQDTSDNGIALGGTAFTQTLDTTPPQMSPIAPTFDESTGKLVLTFNETVKAGDANVDQSKIFVRDGQGTTGGENLDGSAVADGAGLIITVTLTHERWKDAIGHANPHVYLEAGAVKDTSDTPIAATASLEIDDTADNVAPRLHASTAPTLDEATGVLVLTFDETVNGGDAGVDQSKIFVRDGQGITGGTALTGAAVPSQDGETVRLVLAERQRQETIGYATPHVYFAADGATADFTGNVVPASATSVEITDTPDTAKPTLSGIQTISNGIVTLTFNEIVKAGDAGVDQSKIFVRDGQGITGGTALAGAAVVSAGNAQRIIITLTEALRTTIGAYAAPHVYFEAGAVKDFSDNDIAASAQSEDLNTPPQIDATGRHTFDVHSGVMTILFNEAVDDDVDQSKIYLRDGPGISGGTPLAGAEVALSAATAVSITLTEAQRQTAIDYTIQPHVYFLANAVKDTENLGIERSTRSTGLLELPDTILPALKASGPLGLDLTAGMIVVTFTEAVTAVEPEDMFVRGGPGTADGTSMRGAVEQVRGPQVILTLTELQRRVVGTYAEPHFYIGLGAVEDRSGNEIEKSLQSAALDTTLDIPPPRYQVLRRLTRGYYR